MHITKVNGKKEIVDNPNLSKSGSLLNEIQKKNISHQEYAMELSFLHQKTLNGITNNEDIKFAEVAKNSLSDAIIILNIMFDFNSIDTFWERTSLIC